MALARIELATRGLGILESAFADVRLRAKTLVNEGMSHRTHTSKHVRIRPRYLPSISHFGRRSSALAQIRHQRQSGVQSPPGIDVSGVLFSCGYQSL